MAVTIQDDMLRAASMLPKAQRAAFLVALLDYGEYGIEPKGKPQWLPTFEACKERVQLSKQRYDKGKQMADARWNKQDAQASCTNADKHHAQASCTDANKHRTENENESENANAMRGEAVSTHARAQEWCMEKPTEGFRVLDNRDKGHSKPSESLLATYASVHGSNAGFERVVRAMGRPACEGCDRSQERIIACHNVTRDALVRWDRPLDGDPARIVGKLLREDVDNYG